MSAATVKRFVAKAKRELTTKERAAVASEILASLEYPGEQLNAEEAAEAWRDEAVRRAEQVSHGNGSGTPAAEVHASFLGRLRAKR